MYNRKNYENCAWTVFHNLELEWRVVPWNAKIKLETLFGRHSLGKEKSYQEVVQIHYWYQEQYQEFVSGSRHIWRLIRFWVCKWVSAHCVPCHISVQFAKSQKRTYQVVCLQNSSSSCSSKLETSLSLEVLLLMVFLEGLELGLWLQLWEPSHTFNNGQNWK